MDVSGFAALGVAVTPRAEREGVFELWDMNLTAFELFQSVQTQWRFAIAPNGRPVRMGFDYAGVRAAMQLGRVADPDGSLFLGLQAMEFAAVAAFEGGAR